MYSSPVQGAINSNSFVYESRAPRNPVWWAAKESLSGIVVVAASTMHRPGKEWKIAAVVDVDCVRAAAWILSWETAFSSCGNEAIWTVYDCRMRNSWATVRTAVACPSSWLVKNNTALVAIANVQVGGGRKRVGGRWDVL